MLSNIQIKNLKPKEKVYRVADYQGLTIEVKPNGVKTWRFRFRYDGKASMLTLGNYPGVSLLDARMEVGKAKLLLEQGKNPVAERRANIRKNIELANVPKFGVMFEQWFKHNESQWSAKFAKDVYSKCHKYLLPDLSNLPLNEISPRMLVKLLKAIEEQEKINTLGKVREYLGRIFRFAVGVGACRDDPTRDLPTDIFKKAISKNYATTTNPQEISEILSLIRMHTNKDMTGYALKLAPYVFLRSSELVSLKWTYINFEKKLISIPKEVMKMNKDHLVPMSDQVISLLKEVELLKNGSEYVFPSAKSKYRPIHQNSLLIALRAAGISKDKLTIHGFRHMASTLLNELGWPSDAIERQLSHVPINKVRATYNKAEYLDIRYDMMQAWSDWLDLVKN